MHIRFRFAKLGKVRFTSQRDVARMWERALRRARLPLAYTEGFSPRPRLSFGLALPTGCESEAEYLDVVLDAERVGPQGIAAATLPAVLSPLLPDGVVVHEAARLTPGRGSLQQLVTSCSWTVDVAGVAREGLEAKVAAFLEAPSVHLIRERKGRPVEDDIRPAVLSLTVADPGAPVGPARSATATVRLVTELATLSRGIRPLELVRGVAASGEPAGDRDGDANGTSSGCTIGTPVLDRACRTHQWIERDGIRAEPLEWGRQMDADRVGHAWERAS